MKWMFLIISLLIFAGCASRSIKSDNPSYELQHSNAQKAWKNLDNK